MIFEIKTYDNKIREELSQSLLQETMLKCLKNLPSNPPSIELIYIVTDILYYYLQEYHFLFQQSYLLKQIWAALVMMVSVDNSILHRLLLLPHPTFHDASQQQFHAAVVVGSSDDVAQQVALLLLRLEDTEVVVCLLQEIFRPRNCINERNNKIDTTSTEAMMGR